MPSRLAPRAPTYSTFVDLVRERAAKQPDRLAYAYLLDGEQDTARLTYADLDLRVRALAAELLDRGAERERVLLLLPPGLDYVVAFFGALAAGAVAVPAYPTRPGRSNRALDAIIADARATIAVVKAPLRPHDAVGLGPGISVVVMDDLDPKRAGDWKRPRFRRDQLAMLQYTSGSTATPRGAMMSHEFLVRSSAATKLSISSGPEVIGVSWLPLYHDFGLFGTILQPLYAGFPVTMMAPMAFLQRPMRWLEAISRLGGTVTAAPNFALGYALGAVCLVVLHCGRRREEPVPGMQPLGKA